MGASSSQCIFTEEELQDYLDLTFLSKGEIFQVYSRFRSLAPSLIDLDKNTPLSPEKITALPELQVNPFKDRICHVFSSQRDGNITFEDFLDMMSVFSESAPTSTKIEYAFRIYDFDQDDMLGANDVCTVVRRLTGDRAILTEEDVRLIVDKVFAEADLDGDGYLSYAEFEHAMTKSIDFATAYRIQL